MGRNMTKIVHFSSPEEFRKWLAKNHAAATELFVGFYKTTSGKRVRLTLKRWTKLSASAGSMASAAR